MVSAASRVRTVGVELDVQTLESSMEEVGRFHTCLVAMYLNGGLLICVVITNSPI